MTKTSLEEVIKFREVMFDQSMDLIKKKGHDYNNKQQEEGDTLFNLRVAEILGVADTIEQGIMIRLCDKMMRLISLTRPGVKAQVRDESILDTVKDVHNYVDCLVIEWMKRNAQEKEEKE